MTHYDPTTDPDIEPAIADDNAPLPPAHRPTRWTVRRGRAIASILLGLAVATGLGSVYFTYQASQRTAAQAQAVERRLTVLEKDLAERTAQRDAERDATAQEQEQFRANLCVVLGELPSSPGLDSIRSALHCPQPGVPAGTPAPAGRAPGALPSAAAHPAPPAAAPAAAPTLAAPSPDGATPTPTPTPAPGLLCGLLPLC